MPTYMAGDPAYEMYRQATLGDVDFIMGDYLAGNRHLTRACVHLLLS